MTIESKLKLIRDTPIEELLDSGSSGVNHFQDIADVHRYLFNEGCGACASKMRGYINRIKSYNINNMSNFRLKGDVCITSKALNGRSVSNGNLTDEIAIAVLSDHPNRPSFFEKLPEGWEKMVEDYKNGGKPKKTQPKKNTTNKKAQQKKEA